LGSGFPVFSPQHRREQLPPYPTLHFGSDSPDVPPCERSALFGPSPAPSQAAKVAVSAQRDAAFLSIIFSRCSVPPFFLCFIPYPTARESVWCFFAIRIIEHLGAPRYRGRDFQIDRFSSLLLRLFLNKVVAVFPAWTTQDLDEFLLGAIFSFLNVPASPRCVSGCGLARDGFLPSKWCLFPLFFSKIVLMALSFPNAIRCSLLTGPPFIL